MPEDVMQQALQELGSQSDSQPAETAQELLEFYAGDQTYKVPLTAEAAIKHNGAIQKAPIEKILNAYRQAAHVEDKFKELKNQRALYEQERGDLDQFKALKQKYSAIQEWSERNPQEWEALWSIYENKDQYLHGQTAQGQTYNPDVMQLREELSELKKFRDEFQQQQMTQQEQESVKQVEQEIEAFKKEYPQLDLSEADLDGISLQGLIIKHGIENGYPDFRSAALTYPGLMHRLLDTTQKQSRTEAVKSIKRDTAKGVISRSNMPIKGQGANVDTRRLNENDRMDKAKAELATLLGN